MSIVHSLQRHVALLPRYVTRFNCIGAQCEDNCCTGWSVAIDQKTFAAYQSSGNERLAERFARNVERQTHGSARDYAVIRMNPQTRECSFLDDGLCAIHRELGPGFLSNACFDYPRLTRRVSGEMQQALFISCPEAARLLLLDADAFDFVQQPIMVREESVNHANLPAAFNEVRIFCLQLLRTEDLALWQRVAILGMFCDRLKDLDATTPVEEIHETLDDFIAWIGQGNVAADLGEVVPDHRVQMQLFSSPWQAREMQGLTALELEIHEKIIRGLGDARNTSETERCASYLEGIRRLEQALNEVPHFFSNYLLNEMFRDAFPFGCRVYDHYLRIIIRFGILRTMLSGLCNAEEILPSPLLLASTAQSAARRFQHQASLEMKIVDTMKQHGLDRLGQVFTLLNT